jgi:trk system potassium uptake protein
MFNKRYIFHVIGLLLVLESLFMLVPVFISILYKENFFALVLSAMITLSIGGLIWLTNRDPEVEIGKREGYLIAAVIWIIFAVFGALPFLISGSIPRFTDAFFETMSGFTGTGASIIPDVEKLPHGLLFWRSMTHLIGGIGILVLSIIVLPIFGTGSMYLYSAEASSVNTGKLHPKIKDTASRLLWIYFAFIGILTILLLLGGMNLFESLCHAFGTISSGSFSPKNTSIAGYSPYIQYVIAFFMLLAAINFNLHYFILKGAFKRLAEDEEVRLFAYIFLGALIIISGSLFIIHHYNVEESFRYSFFQVASIISTTGYVNTNYMLWSPFMWFILFLLMFIGGCAGSTSGGIKIVRYLLLFKNIPVQFRKLLHERGVIAIRLNGDLVREELIFRTLAFFVIYLLVWVISTFLLMVSGLPLTDSMGGTASCLAGCGPGLGSVGPLSNYAHLTDFAKMTLSFDMLAGRLEIFSFLILFTPFFWKNK